MSDLGGLIKKEFGRIRADKRSLVLLFAIPLILIVTLGFTAGGTTTFFNAAIITLDDIECEGNFPDNRTSLWDDSYISICQNNCSAFGLDESKPYINVTNDQDYQSAVEEYTALLKSEDIDVFIIIPKNFSEVIENGTQNIQLSYVIDGSDKTSVDAIQVAFMEPSAYFRFEAGLLENMTQIVPYPEYDVPSWKTQILNYALSMMLPLLILGLDMNLSSLSIVSEGPLPRMLLTPTGKKDIILSKLISYTIIAALQVTEIFAVTAIFDLYCLGSLFDFFFVLLATGFCGVCMGLFISAISKTEQVANQLYLMMFIVLVMFSGFMPSELLPDIFVFFIDILPLTHSMDLLSGIAMRGAGINFSDMFSILVVAFIFVIMAYIAYTFKTKLKRLEV